MFVVGHKKQITSLINAFHSDFCPKVYLFYGQAKLGKRRIALELTKFIETGYAFGDERDYPINKRIELNKYPDLKIIEPTKKSEKSRPTISIEEIEKLAESLSLRPFSGKRKVVIIDDAHYLNYDAQGALLKTLEEARDDIVFFLITPYPRMLISTILSRSMNIYFSPVSSEDIKNFLIKNKGLPAKKAEEISLLSFNKPGLALDLLDNPTQEAEAKTNFDNFLKLSQSDLFIRFNFSKLLSTDKEKINRVLKNWLVYLRLILLNKFAPQKYLREGAKKGLPNLSDEKLAEMINLVQEARFNILNTNVSSRLALENLLLNLGS